MKWLLLLYLCVGPNDCKILRIDRYVTRTACEMDAGRQRLQIIIQADGPIQTTFRCVRQGNR